MTKYTNYILACIIQALKDCQDIDNEDKYNVCKKGSSKSNTCSQAVNNHGNVMFKGAYGTYLYGSASNECTLAESMHFPFLNL